MLEKRKTSTAAVYALVLGILWTACMAGTTFAVTAQPPHIALCIILAIPGFLGWILPYFLYKKIQSKETEKVTSLLEGKYEEVLFLCALPVITKIFILRFLQSVINHILLICLIITWSKSYKKENFGLSGREHIRMKNSPAKVTAK